MDVLLFHLRVKVSLSLPGSIMQPGLKVFVSLLLCPVADRNISGSKLSETFVTTLAAPEYHEPLMMIWATQRV
jgi:hypothetical protein